MFTRTQHGSERLAQWRQFRQRTNVTAEQVVEAFASTPLDQRYLDYYTPDTWPSVFEIVEEGMFCQSGLTLVIASTLLYFNIIKTDTIVLKAISNHITGDDGLVLVVDGKVYNFLSGQITSEQYLQDNSTCYDTHIITATKLYS